MSKATTAGVENNQVTAKVGEVVRPEVPKIPDQWYIQWYDRVKKAWVFSAAFYDKDSVEWQSECVTHAGNANRIVHIPGEGGTHGT